MHRLLRALQDAVAATGTGAGEVELAVTSIGTGATLDAEGQSRIFDVHNGARLRLGAITLANGHARELSTIRYFDGFLGARIGAALREGRQLGKQKSCFFDGDGIKLKTSLDMLTSIISRQPAGRAADAPYWIKRIKKKVPSPLATEYDRYIRDQPYIVQQRAANDLGEYIVRLSKAMWELRRRERAGDRGREGYQPTSRDHSRVSSRYGEGHAGGRCGGRGWSARRRRGRGQRQAGWRRARSRRRPAAAAG